MRRNMTFLVCLGASIITLWAGLARAIPPKPEIPEDALKRQLIPTYRNQISERIKWWADMIVNARKSSEIIAARKGLLADYELYKSERYQAYFAWDSAKNFKDLLEGKGLNEDDGLMAEKQINIALALSEMSQPPIVPTLDDMIGSRNQGLRYLGWKGYQSLCEQLIKSPKTLNPLLKNIEDAIKAETNPQILQKVFSVMETACNSKGVSSIIIRPLKAKMVDIFEAAWPGWKTKVAEGQDTAAIEIAGNAVTTLVEIATSKPGDLTNNDRTKILQMILDEAYAAAVTYNKILQAGETKFADIANEKTRNNKIAENQELQQAYSQLLLACDDGLAAVSGDKKSPIRQALNAEVAKGAAVQGSVLAWASSLKKSGVKDPVATPKAPTAPTKPAEN